LKFTFPNPKIALSCTKPRQITY